MKKKTHKVCLHDYVYKILYPHIAANICTKCGHIELQKPTTIKNNKKSK